MSVVAVGFVGSKGNRPVKYMYLLFSQIHFWKMKINGAVGLE